MSSPLSLLVLLPHPGVVVMLLLLLVSSIALMFAGRQMIEVLAFILAGFFSGSLVSSVIEPYYGTGAALAGGVSAFILGGFLSFLLLPLGVGIVLGILGYFTAEAMVGIQIVAISIGVLSLIVGIIFARRISQSIAALLGALILFHLGLFIGFPVALAGLSVLSVATLGLIIQKK